MALENKLGITESTELAKAEERISKHWRCFSRVCWTHLKSVRSGDFPKSINICLMKYTTLRDRFAQ